MKPPTPTKKSPIMLYPSPQKQKPLLHEIEVGVINSLDANGLLANPIAIIYFRTIENLLGLFKRDFAVNIPSTLGATFLEPDTLRIRPLRISCILPALQPRHFSPRSGPGLCSAPNHVG